MTNLEIIAIKSVASRINSLAHLENTCFDPFNKEHDEQIKKDIRVWLQWFSNCAEFLEDIVNLSENEKGYYKKLKLEEIIKYTTW